MNKQADATLTACTKQQLLTAGEKLALARLITLADDTQQPDTVTYALALTFSTQRHGDVCVALDNPSDTDIVTLPDTATWAAQIGASNLVSSPNENTLAPFVLEQNRLYLRRAYEQEQALIAAINTHVAQHVPVDETWLTAALSTVYGQPSATGVNRQRLATAISLTRGLSVIAGGPGSGKTYTVARILTLLQRWHETNATKPLQVVLAAPTGRAAARLSATLIAAGVTPDTPAMTLHRLLGWRASGNRSQSAQSEPLAADVVIVDEASMVGLPLFTALLGALKADARLILLGDSNQLGAIDTGAVFHELCGPDTPDDPLTFSPQAVDRYARITGEPVDQTSRPGTPGITDVIVRLNVTHRFKDTGGVGQAAALLRDTGKEVTALVDELATLSATGTGFTLLSERDATTGLDALIATAVDAYNDATNAVLTQNDPVRALQLFDRFRLLCAIHDGAFGTRAINQRILTALGARNPAFRAERRFNPGRFVLVTRNDATAGIQNGDVGVVVATANTSQPHVAFLNGVDTVHTISPYRLYEPDDPYAMSVHKAQGSQFNQVALLLPETPTPVATRSLVYTAITRASEQATVLDPGGTLAGALRQMDVRVSGLSAALFGPTGNR